jgi:hypothetical protein
VQVYFNSTPVSRDIALKSLQSLLPADSTTSEAPDVSEIKAAKVPHPMEVLQYGKDYKGQIAYADKKANSVILVNAWYLPTEVSPQ